MTGYPTILHRKCKFLHVVAHEGCGCFSKTGKCWTRVFSRNEISMPANMRLSATRGYVPSPTTIGPGDGNVSVRQWTVTSRWTPRIIACESPHLLCLSRRRESPKIVRKKTPNRSAQKNLLVLGWGWDSHLFWKTIFSKPSFQDQLCIAYASSKTLAPNGTKMKSQPQPIFSCTKSMGCWQCHM